MRKRLLAMILAFAMLFSTLPMAPVFAEDKCLSKDALTKQFEDAANELFGSVGSKDGVYVGKFDPTTKTVKVAILDKNQGAKEISGTGLIAGLIKLYNENYLTKVKIGNCDERDLKERAEAAPSAGMKVDEMFKLVFGTDILNAVQSEGKTGKLADFIDKSVDLKLTVQQPGCKEAVELTYRVSGAEAKSVLLKDKLEAKDIKAWVGDEIDWKKGVALKDADEKLQAILDEAGTVVTDESNRKSDNENTTGLKGDLNVAFDDGTSLEVKDQVLYVSNHMTAASNDKAPEDAVLVKFLLGEGVEAKKGDEKLIGTKEKPAVYESFKVKPGTDLSAYKIPSVEKTIFESIAAEAKTGPTWFPENHIVSDKNNIFTAEARLPMSKAPEVDKIVAGDKKVTGKGIADATIEVTFPGVKTPVKTTVGTDGTWSVNVPKGIILYAKDTITVVQTEKNKDPNAVTAVVKAKSGDGYIVTPVIPGDKKPEEKKAQEKPSTATITGYINGYPDGTFRPGKSMTRAEAASILAKLQRLPLTDSSKPAFSDADGWYNAVINAVVKAGYMKGYPDGSFKPDKPITRAEFATMLSHFMSAKTASNPFTDTNGNWAKEAIDKAYAQGIIKGYEDNTFRPAADVSRAEAVAMVNRTFNIKKAGDVKNPFTDISPSHWAYEDILAAVSYR
ncbi:S-layer homology domain-containing protein [Aedoeadaptatus acetigenes]|uniref:S-layer homology domain-containing protein n=1 Tax=Aedoeadaptatus acetigenes TaxID=2981723 RepID=UPI0011DE41CB|nr:S-layer homology domain-containing protein [Aedoeadaptatus acetigenes]MCU6786889.1 S-layer homology domain-containing protein [Aedoeadaptatus acetigenes]